MVTVQTVLSVVSLLLVVAVAVYGWLRDSGREYSKGVERLAKVETKINGLENGLENVKGNEIAHLRKTVEGLPCLEHMEELVKHTGRLEVVAERLENVERRLNGRG